MNTNNIFNQKNLAAIVEICDAIKTVAKATSHTHHIPKIWHEGDVSMHRVGSEICRLARKGEAKRCNVRISPQAQQLLTVMVNMTGHDTGHHSDHTYRNIATAIVTMLQAFDDIAQSCNS